MKKNKKEIQEELEALAPSFSKMEKEEVFQVPENYFNDLPNQILEELNLTKEEVKVEEKSSWWTALMDQVMILLQPRIAIGLATFLLLGASFFYLQNQNSENVLPLAELTATEAESYILENIDEFEDELLYEMALEIDRTPNDLESQELNNYLEEIIDEMDDDALEELL